MNRMLRMAARTGVGWRVWLLFFVVVAVDAVADVAADHVAAARFVLRAAPRDAVVDQDAAVPVLFVPT